MRKRNKWSDPGMFRHVPLSRMNGSVMWPRRFSPFKRVSIVSLGYSFLHSLSLFSPRG